MDLDHFEKILNDKAEQLYPATDPSHDILHIRRVVATAKKLAAEEGADLAVVIPAAYLHDCVNVPKNDPRRKEASRLSAAAAVEYLSSINYPAQHLDAIAHAIAAHSFSAGIPPETIEAKVVQDADRLDGLGAVGIARLFTVNGLIGTPYYFEDDMLCVQRAPDDKKFAVDHFYAKLFKTAETMQTAAATSEAALRVVMMKDYLSEFKREIEISAKTN